MYQRPKCPYSYFLKELEFYLKVLSPCEYPEGYFITAPETSLSYNIAKIGTIKAFMPQ